MPNEKILRVRESATKGRVTIKGKELHAWTKNMCEAYVEGDMNLVRSMARIYLTDDPFVSVGAPGVRTTITLKEASDGE